MESYLFFCIIIYLKKRSIIIQFEQTEITNQVDTIKYTKHKQKSDHILVVCVYANIEHKRTQDDEGGLTVVDL